MDMSKLREVAGYEGKYRVSGCGRIFKKCGSEVGQWMSDQGYMLVRLSRPRKMLRVHRVVAEAFVPNPNRLPVVNHIDGVRHNNHAENLEWCTQQENLQHADSAGRLRRDNRKGKRSPRAALSDDMAAQIRNIYAGGGISWEALGRQLGVSKRTVGRIVKNESYI